MSRSSFAASGKAQTFSRGCFHGDRLRANVERTRDIRPHRPGMRHDAGPFENNGRIDIANLKARTGKQQGDFFQEQQAGDPPVPCIGIRKMLPDITQGRCPEQRIGDRMDKHIRV